MGTMVKTQVITITGNDVREVAGCIWDQLTALDKHYGIRLPYDMQQLRLDLGQILMWGMTQEIKLQFYDSENVERLKYGFVPIADRTVVHSPPGEFPRFEIPPGLQVRLVAEHTTSKPETEVRKFFQGIGWSPCEPLMRTGSGSTTTYGAFRSGDFPVSRDVYSDLPNKFNQSARKETQV